MLACFDCRNLERFDQVSERADRRELLQTMEGLQRGAFDHPDSREPGVYCGQCHQPVEADIDALGLTDDRVTFVPPSEFSVHRAAAAIQALRPDASWHRLDLAARAARHAEVPSGLHPAVAEALANTGRLPLYTHQADSVQAALDGRPVVQATSAGSGKSLGLLAPVLDALVRSRTATALVAFPLRALANDQLHSLAGLGPSQWVNESSFDLQLGGDVPAVRVSRYDGSTLNHERKPVRQHARLLITTPDSLHLSILRYGLHAYSDGTSWTRILAGLRFVVLDEIHVYQGVFGSNVAQVVRRLRRMASALGAHPQFLAASATIGNPVEHAERLTGVSGFRLVEEDGSPQHRRVVLICNPPVQTESAKKQAEPRDDTTAIGGQAVPPVPIPTSGRVAPQTVAIDILTGGALVPAAENHPDPIRSICFGRSRVEVFSLTRRIQGRLKEMRAGGIAANVRPYAATLLADDRVEEEGKLRDGTTLTVVSTSALELGIDVPDLSLAVLCGYPGQIASFRQRAGRVGRAGEGLVVLIVGDDPLQQFVASDPRVLDDLLHGRAEDVVINPDAPEIVRRFGLLPGQAELGGLAPEDTDYFGEATLEWLADATGRPTVQRNGVSYWLVPTSDESHQNLRSTGSSQQFTVVIRSQGNKAVGTIDAGTAPRDCFVPAIWSDAANTYRVIGFDRAMSQIFCEGPVETPYLTRGVPVDSVEVVGSPADSFTSGAVRVEYGTLSITRRVHSYKLVSIGGGGEASAPVSDPKWPPVAFTTDGFRLELPATWLNGAGPEPDEAVKGLEHVLLSLAPVVVACDPYDLDATHDGPAVYLYDSFGADIGLSHSAFTRLNEITALGIRLVENCGCAHGCPSCVFLARRPDGNQGVSKAGALHLLSNLASASTTPSGANRP